MAETRASLRAERLASRARARRRLLGGGLALGIAASVTAGIVLAQSPTAVAEPQAATSLDAIAAAQPQSFAVGDASRADLAGGVAEAREGGAEVSVVDTSPASLKKLAAQMIQSQYGWGADQMQCLDQLWTKESNWRWNATNPDSGAYGIPQSWPAEKLAAAGADWQTNPVTQMQWGIDYIKRAHGTPCTAWNQHNGSY